MVSVKLHFVALVYRSEVSSTAFGIGPEYRPDQIYFQHRLVALNRPAARCVVEGGRRLRLAPLARVPAST